MSKVSNLLGRSSEVPMNLSHYLTSGWLPQSTHLRIGKSEQAHAWEPDLDNKQISMKVTSGNP